jgi:hypothetical protein
VHNLARILASARHRQVASEVRQVDAWSRAEVETLLQIASELEPGLLPSSTSSSRQLLTEAGLSERGRFSPSSLLLDGDKR